MLGVTRLSVQGRGGLSKGYVFDEHRLALPCWADALEHRADAGAVLLTLDRHFDLVAPKKPPRDASAAELDRWTREDADPRNVDHILAAMELGLVSDVIAVARSWPRGAVEGSEYVDGRGRKHRLLCAPTIERLPPEAVAMLQHAPHTVFDVDLDCFTTPSDADPTTLVPWPKELIRDFLVPADPLWDALLPRCAALTLAREPYHCGGLVATGRLFEVAAQVLFVELLRADLP